MSQSLRSAFVAAAAAQGDLPVTAGVQRWNDAGRPITPEAIARVMQVMINDIQGRADGSGRIRPSSIGQDCKRYMILSFLGMDAEDFPEETLDIMDGGTWGHYKWQTRGLSAGWLSDIEVPVQDTSWLLKGSADGIIAEDGSLFELKTCNTWIFDQVRKENKPKWPHIMQAGGMMRALGLEKGSIVYEDRNTPSRWREFRITYDDTLDFALSLLKRDIRTHIRNREVPVMRPDCEKQKGETYHECQFRYSCPMAGWPQ